MGTSMKRIVPYTIDRRLLDAMRKMSPGTLGGQSRVATPASYIQPATLGNIGVDPIPPEPENCPTFIGRTDATLGVGGPYPNRTLTEIMWGVSNEIHRYSYPDL